MRAIFGCLAVVGEGSGFRNDFPQPSSRGTTSSGISGWGLKDGWLTELTLGTAG